MTDDPVDGWAAHDLEEAVRRGLERGAPLLTAGEHRVAHTILGLRGPPATVFARLVARKPLAFPRDELGFPEALTAEQVDDALTTLEREGLVDGFVPWSWRADLATRTRLVAGCRRLGLRRNGRRAELEGRLRDRRQWDPTRWVRPRHRSLVRRLQRWAVLRAWPQPQDVVLERMGQVRYVPHPVTTGPGLHPDRRALLQWEQVHAAIGAGTLDCGAAMDALESLPAPRGMSLRGSLLHVVEDAARALEGPDPEAALTIYERLVARGAPTRVHFRRARTLEAMGRASEALEHLLAARELVDEEGRRTLARSGRRIARTLGRGFPPERPLPAPRRRTLGLSKVGSEARPLWTDEALAVEAAVVQWLAAHGRDALHTEGRLWRSLFALVMADAYFLDVPEALPVPRLSAPFDLGTPAFRARRPLVEERLRGVREGHAEALLDAAWSTYGGFRVAGLHPDVPLAWLQRAARQVPGPALADVLDHLLTGRSSGIPDLFVAAGPEVSLPSHPSRLAAGPMLVEVKGPGDTLSDRQRVWMERWRAAQVAVELWEVRPA